MFDCSRIKLQSIMERVSDLKVDCIKKLCKVENIIPEIEEIAKKIIAANKKDNSVIMLMGAHVIRAGVQRYIIDMMKKGCLSCVSMNGAGMIHDFEFARFGQTTESVSNYIQKGEFGLWKETGKINDIVNEAFKLGIGMGEGVGKVIYEGDYPYKDISILSEGYRLKVPVTIHVGIGYDIIHEHPNFSGAAAGETSYRDFLILAKIIEKLNDGVVMNFGSAVMAPEIFLKTLSMARNVAYQKGERINRFNTLVCDLHELPENFCVEPSKNEAIYYFRPLKTMLIRTVSDGGKGYYVRGSHEKTIPTLWSCLLKYKNL